MESASVMLYDLSARVRQQPYQSLLIAAGIGYVLGGGLFTRLTYNTVRVGLRVGAPLLQRQILGAAMASITD